MSETTLPTGWVWTTIGEVADTTSGGTPSRKRPDYYGGNIPWIKSGELRDGLITSVDEFITEEALQNSSAKIFPEGTAVVALYGATVGRTGILGLGAATNQAVCAIFPRQKAFTAKFITYWLKYQRKNLIDLSVGGAQPNISQGIIKSYHLPLPPLAEQHRIVAEIEKQLTRLEAGVAALHRAQARLQRYKAAVLKAACEGRLVPQNPDGEPAAVLLERILTERREQWTGKGKYKEPQPPNIDDLPELPVGWVWASAEQLCDFITKGTTPKANKLFDGEGDIPFIKVYNLTFGGKLDFTINPTFVSYETHSQELARSLVLPGDVLMNIVGPPLGKVSIAPSLYPEWNMNQAVARFRPMPGYDRKFLSYCLMAEPILNWATRRAKATAGQFNLTLQICRELPLPIPPFPEQQRIVAEVERRLSVVEEVETALSANLHRAERLRQSILKQAFAGRLVAQEADDEPASVLLERIRQEREKGKGRQLELPGV